MPRDLPVRPNLEHLKNQAKTLLDDFEQGKSSAVERLRSARSFSDADQPKLADAQHEIAREYGFGTWAKLKHHVELLAQPPEALKSAVVANDSGRVKEVLKLYPELKAKLDGALPNYGFGSTSLIVAVQRSNREMIDILLSAGADINARTNWWAGGFGVLDEAAHPDRDPGLALFLIERGAVVDVHAATALRMFDKLKELIGANPDLVHARGGDGQTPLHFAPTVEIARYLLEQGAKIDARDIDHESTPAQYMVRDRPDVAGYLMERGCRTDILMAAALGDIGRVRQHLDADPDCIRMSVSERWFPKQNPRAGGSIYIWTLGANKTAHVIAREFGHDEVFNLLMQCSPAALKLSLACELGDESLFKAVLGKGPDLVSTLSEDDRSKLPAAAQSDNAAAVCLMLKAGWPVDARGQYGATALHWAAFHGNVEMVREILSYRPPLEVFDANYDGKPLGWAIHGSIHGWKRTTGDYQGTVETLLEAGAEPPKLSDELEASEAVRAVLRRYADAK